MNEDSTPRERGKYTPGDTGHARAAVITPGRVFYGDGTVAEARPGVVADLAGILAGTDRMAPECTVVLDGVQLDALRPPDTSAGWTHRQLDGWTTFRRAGRVVSLGVRSAMVGRHLDVLFGRDTEPGTLAMLLDRYHRLTGVAWRGTAGMSSLSLMRLTWENPQHQPLWHAPETGAGHVGPLHWTRPLNEWEATWGYVHTFDANSAYLGSAGSVDLGWSKLEHTGARPYDQRRPGYWLIEPANSSIDLDAEPGRPPLLPARDAAGRVWLTTPYAQLLAQLGDPLHVIDSWTADKGARVLHKWQNRLRDARVAAEAMPTGGMRDALIRAVKRTATDTFGALARKHNNYYLPVDRPDWAHTLIDLWRANLYRRMVKVKVSEGVWPCAVKVDAISYADVCDQLACPHALDDGGCWHPGADNLARAIGVRPGLGGFKHAGVSDTATWAAQHAVKPARIHAEPRSPSVEGKASRAARIAAWVDSHPEEVPNG